MTVCFQTLKSNKSNELQVTLGDRFICVQTDLLASGVNNLLDDTEKASIIGLGASGLALARRLQPNCPGLAITTDRFDRERSKRVLRIASLITQSELIMVDDVAVSGLTLRCAKAAITPQPTKAVVGMLFESKTTRRLADLTDIRAAFTYKRESGGNPPINSIATLQSVPERLLELAGRYFKGNKTFIDVVLGGCYEAV
jgi:hypothetical protein